MGDFKEILVPLIVIGVIVLLVVGLLVKGNRFQMVQSATGIHKGVKQGFSFTYLFFGPLVPLFRGHFAGFFMTLFISIFTCGIGHLIFLFCYNTMYINFLAKQGFERVPNSDIPASGFSAFTAMEEVNSAPTYPEHDERKSHYSPPTPAPTYIPATATTPTPPPKLQAMALYENRSHMWSPGMPVLLTLAQIVRCGDGEDKVGLNVEFQNISAKKIIAIYFDVRCFNMLRQEQEPVLGANIIDLQVTSRMWYLSQKPIPLPLSDTRRCVVVLKNVVFADDEIWESAEGAPGEPLPEQPKIQIGENYRQDFDQMARHLSENGASHFSFQPMAAQNYWLCACGEFNLPGEELCTGCQSSRKSIFELVDPERLAQKHAERLEQEQLTAAKRAEEERQYEERKRQRQLEEEARIAEEQRRREEKLEQLRQQTASLLHAGKAGLDKAVAGTKAALEPMAKTIRQEKTVCPACGNENPWDSAFCENCGAKLTAAPPTGETAAQEAAPAQETAAQEAAPAQEAAEGHLACSQCGTSNDEDGKFCCECGAKLHIGADDGEEGN